MSWEIDFLNWIQGFRCGALDWLMPKLTMLGDAGIIWIVMALIFLFIPKTRKMGCLMALALVVDVLLCNCILKPIIDRPRPFEKWSEVTDNIKYLVKKPTDASFPSGHTAASFACVVAIYIAKEKKWFVGSLVLAITIAFTRLYLFVHYPTDVLAGIVVGIVSGIAGGILYKLLEKPVSEFFAKKKLNKASENADK